MDDNAHHVASPQIASIDSFPSSTVQAEGTRGLIVERDGGRVFGICLFEVERGGHTPLHSHDYEHQVFILSGSGELSTAEGPRAFKAGDAIYIPSNVLHQFCNTGEGTMKFMNLIPRSKEPTK